MTEAEWNACTDPQPMLEFLRGKVSDRKLRLFAAACCRQIWDLQLKEAQDAIEVAEQFADGDVSKKRLYLAMSATDNGPGQDVQGGRRTATYAAYLACMYPWNRHHAGLDPNDVSRYAAVAVYRMLYDANLVADAEKIVAAKRAAHAQLLRDIFGPLPFRSIALDPSWLTSTVTSLATAIYQERAFDRLAILADALEDSGCTNQEVLGHLRGGGDHCRGCWPVDLILQKE